MRVLKLSTAALLLVFQCIAASETAQHSKQKRQIFREQLLPHSGGKIPEGAFRSDRLALNRLNKEGIAIPDGILLESRHRESHFKSHRNDPDIQASIVKLVQTPDGRYAPPEGRYPFNNLVESTYLIRKPINTRGNVIPPQHPLTSPLRLPATSIFHNEEETLFTLNNLDSFDVLSALGTDILGSRVWTGFGRIYHDIPNRILRRASAEDGVAAEGRYPSLTSIPKTGFTCSPSSPYSMQADPYTGCQVFHLCRRDGGFRKESYLCPVGSRFDPQRRQCRSWKEIPCAANR